MRVEPTLKRTLDVVLASFGLLVLSPVVLAAAVLVLVSMGRPIIYRQVRPGLHGRPFVLYKFRTMRPESGKVAGPGSDAVRLTRTGRFLRRYSLDEIPQLINVLRGEMSLVGPRPLLMEYLELYSEEDARRHAVRPGVTGLAQVLGRNRLAWPQVFRLDRFYVAHQSTGLDLKILLLTIRRVLRDEGVSQQGRATREEFRGSSG